MSKIDNNKSISIDVRLSRIEALFFRKLFDSAQSDSLIIEQTL